MVVFTSLAAVIFSVHAPAAFNHAIAPSLRIREETLRKSKITLWLQSISLSDYVYVICTLSPTLWCINHSSVWLPSPTIVCGPLQRLESHCLTASLCVTALHLCCGVEQCSRYRSLHLGGVAGGSTGISSFFAPENQQPPLPAQVSPA